MYGGGDGGVAGSEPGVHVRPLLRLRLSIQATRPGPLGCLLDCYGRVSVDFPLPRVERRAEDFRKSEPKRTDVVRPSPPRSS